MFLLYATLLAVTTLAWGYVFYKKDYHPQPLKVIAQSFAVGLFSMLPIFAYKYLYQNFLPGLSEFRFFQPILESALGAGLIVFVANLAILSILLFLLGGLLSILLNFFNAAVFINFKNALKQEPMGFGAVSLLLGALVLFHQFVSGYWLSPLVASTLGTVLFLAIIEEYVKHLLVRVTDDKRLVDIDDAITLSIVVGLAFAFVETLIYGWMAGQPSVMFYRSMVSLPVHVVASGVFGYFYGQAHYAKSIVRLKGKEKTLYKVHWFHRLISLKQSTVYSEAKIIEGYLCATLLHAVMNILFEFKLGFLAVPILMASMVLLLRMYRWGKTESKQIEKKRLALETRTRTVFEPRT